jgi:hypothetical protein
LLSAAMSPLLLSSCFYGKNFDLEWDEEVQLHDGRTIVVHLKYTYERLAPGLLPHGGTNILRDSVLTFDAGGRTGRVSQVFRGYHPMFLDQHEGTWYSVLYGGDYGQSRLLPGGDWGEMEGPYGQWTIKLVEGKWMAISMRDLPDQFQVPNVMILYGDASEMASFSGRVVTLADKQRWLELYPLGYAHRRLTRPMPTSRSPASAPSQTTLQGATK